MIAFIFADLIAMPLILIYRKFYGWELTLRIVALFYGVMVIAGLITEGIFSAVGGIPTRRIFKVSSAHFKWNYTTYLNVVFIIVALGEWWFSRNRKRFGGGDGYAIDPVCGMQVRVADAPAIIATGQARLLLWLRAGARDPKGRGRYPHSEESIHNETSKASRMSR